MADALPETLPPREDVTLAAALREGLLAARKNLLPGLVLWIAGVLLLLGYFLVEPLAAALDRLAHVKEGWGLVFPAISTAIFAGLIPWLVMRVRRATRARATPGRLLFLLVFWTERGIEVDLLYRLQAHWFGHGRDVLTLAIKTAVDQLIYVPVWIVPTTVVAYLWFDVGCDWRRTRAAFTGRSGRHWYRRLMLPMLLANLAIWIPAVVIIYTLPLPLQLPIQNLVVCLWSLMLIFLMREEKTGEARLGT